MGGILKKYDDANVPSLLSIPLLGWSKYDPQIYKSTRSMLLSKQNQVEAILAVEGQRAVVLQTFGSGNATRQSWFIEALENAISKGMIILNVSQCDKGSVEQGKYQTSADLKRIGVVGTKRHTLVS